MSALSIQPPYPVFAETDGQPLEDGYIWIGTANLDPQGNPINVYWDAALTQLAAQPIRTQGGYPVNSGTPATLYVNSDYSIRVMNKNGSTVYSAPAATERFSDVVFTGTIDADQVVYQPPGFGAVATTVQDQLELEHFISDFATLADAITAATGSFKLLVNDNLTVRIPTDAANLQTAVDCLAPNNPQITITLNIESGHSPTSGVSVSNGDYSQFRITSTDAEVILSPSFGISNARFVYGNNAKMPRLACLVDANNRTSMGYAAYNGSVGYVEANCGIKNAYSDGCRAYGGSIVYAFDTIWTGCAQNNTTGSGIIAWGGTVFASGADVSNSMYYGAQAAHGGILVIDNGTANNCFRYNLRATDAGWMSADGVTANYAGCAPGTNLPYPDALAAGYGVYAFNGSWIAARDASATNAKHSGVLASNGCTIHVRGATLTDCGEYGVYASPCSTVDATQTNVSGAGTYGYFASGGSTISAASSTANNCGTGTLDAAAYADAASRINVESLDATGCSGIVIRCESGSTINCTGSTITGAGNRSVYASGASIVNASSCTGTGATNEGVFAASGSTINAQSSNFQRGGSPSITDIVVENGSFINAAGATGGVSQTINTLTSEGVIFQ
jgi:hypothetical protein